MKARNEKRISINGRYYQVKQSISGYWRLFYRGVLLFDDPSTVEVNSDMNTAIDYFKELFKELK
jgi:hypothetical protein